MPAPPPTIIEAALNGMTSRDDNPHVPRTVDEIVESAFNCLAAGASIIHNHNDEPVIGGATRHCPEPYISAWGRLRRRHPGLLVYPTMAAATPQSTVEERFAHQSDLYDAGFLAMASVDMGTFAVAMAGADGLVSTPTLFGNSSGDVDWCFRWCKERDVPVHLSIFEPGFLRLTLAHHRAGTLPQAKIQLYFGSDRLIFGLPPTAAALAAYLEMLDGSGLTWMVGVYGGDITANGFARLAIERGGHVRVGLEDHTGGRTPRNEDLVREAADLARAAGRRPAAPDEVAGILWGG